MNERRGRKRVDKRQRTDCGRKYTGGREVASFSARLQTLQIQLWQVIRAQSSSLRTTRLSRHRSGLSLSKSAKSEVKQNLKKDKWSPLNFCKTK